MAIIPFVLAYDRNFHKDLKLGQTTNTYVHVYSHMNVGAFSGVYLRLATRKHVNRFLERKIRISPIHFQAKAFSAFLSIQGFT